MRVAVTGASGYVGRRLVDELRARGHDVISLSSSSIPTGDTRPYRLGNAVADDLLAGADVVIHGAHDFTSRGQAVVETNTLGSRPLLDLASSTDVPVIAVSTLSAFDGCRSNYGCAKLALERDVLDRGGHVVRAGVVFGFDAGGIFGALVNALRSGRVAPYFSGGRQRLYVTHDRALARLLVDLAETRHPAQRPVLAAHHAASSLRCIARHIAAAQSSGRKPVEVPVSWRAGYAGLRAIELLGLELPFRSDSLVALVNPIPLDHVAQLAPSPVAFPRLQADLWRPGWAG